MSKVICIIANSICIVVSKLKICKNMSTRLHSYIKYVINHKSEVEFENLSAGENLLGDYCDGLLRVIGRRSSASHSNHPSGQASSLCRDDLPKTAFAGTEEVMVLDFDGFAIAIIHVELEHLPRLKLVTHFELGLPGRVNGVHDCFCLSKINPIRRSSYRLFQVNCDIVRSLFMKDG